jgi:hypothetical protein
MGAVDFILENWSPRHTAQVVLKLGALIVPMALWLWVPATRRRPGRLVVALGAATGFVQLVVAYLQITRGEFTAALNRWEDSHFAVEVAGYQLAFAFVGGWSWLRRQSEALHGLALALILCVALAGLGNLFGWGGDFPLLAQHGSWALGLGLALVASAVLRRVAWLRAQLAITAASYGYFALVHLHAWLIEGELSMGHVGPSLWYDLALPVLVCWALRRR